jgi:hypothetical protein
MTISPDSPGALPFFDCELKGGLPSVPQLIYITSRESQEPAHRRTIRASSAATPPRSPPGCDLPQPTPARRLCRLRSARRRQRRSLWRRDTPRHPPRPWAQLLKAARWRSVPVSHRRGGKGAARLGTPPYPAQRCLFLQGVLCRQHSPGIRSRLVYGQLSQSRRCPHSNHEDGVVRTDDPDRKVCRATHPSLRGRSDEGYLSAS